MATTAGTHYYRFLTAPGAATGDFVIDVTSTTATVGTFTFDDFNLIHVGAVIDLDFRGMGHLQWHDSETGLWAVLNSAEFYNVPTGHQERVVLDDISSNTSSPLLPAGYKIDSIICRDI